MKTVFKKRGLTGWHAIDKAYIFGDAHGNFTEAKRDYFRAHAQSQGAQNKDPQMDEADIEFAEDFQKKFGCRSSLRLTRI